MEAIHIWIPSLDEENTDRIIGEALLSRWPDSEVVKGVRIAF